jgi:hypothetical protein
MSIVANHSGFTGIFPDFFQFLEVANPITYATTTENCSQQESNIQNNIPGDLALIKIFSGCADGCSALHRD